jgi:hypothetical protein
METSFAKKLTSLLVRQERRMFRELNQPTYPTGFTSVEEILSAPQAKSRYTQNTQPTQKEEHEECT